MHAAGCRSHLRLEPQRRRDLLLVAGGVLVSAADTAADTAADKMDAPEVRLVMRFFLERIGIESRVQAPPEGQCPSVPEAWLR